jgi:hypothetical protein
VGRELRRLLVGHLLRLLLVLVVQVVLLLHVLHVLHVLPVLLWRHLLRRPLHRIHLPYTASVGDQVARGAHRAQGSGLRVRRGLRRLRLWRARGCKGSGTGCAALAEAGRRRVEVAGESQQWLDAVVAEEGHF